jgi:hypothetical protein
MSRLPKTASGQEHCGASGIARQGGPGDRFKRKDMLDDTVARVRNAKLSQAACDSQEIGSLETKQPA